MSCSWNSLGTCSRPRSGETKRPKKSDNRDFSLSAVGNVLPQVEAPSPTMEEPLEMLRTQCFRTLTSKLSACGKSNTVENCRSALSFRFELTRANTFLAKSENNSLYLSRVARIFSMRIPCSEQSLLASIAWCLTLCNSLMLPAKK